MDLKKTFKNIFTVQIAAVIFICALVTDWGYYEFYNSNDFMLLQTQNNIKDISYRMQNYLPTIRNIIQSKSNRFSTIDDLKLEYNLFIAEEKEGESEIKNMVYWSKTPHPDFETYFEDIFTEKCIETEAGIYFLKQMRFSTIQTSYTIIFSSLIFRYADAKLKFDSEKLENESTNYPLITNINYLVKIDKTLEIPIYNDYGLYLFSLIREHDKFSLGNSYLSLIAYLVSFIFVGINIFIRIFYEQRSNQVNPWLAFGLLAIIKILLIDFNLLRQILDGRIPGSFNTKVFTLLDGIGNEVAAVFCIYGSIIILQKSIWRIIKDVFYQQKIWKCYLCILILIFIIHYVLIRNIEFIKYLCFDLNINIDINYNISFGELEIVSIITLVLSFVNLFYFINLLANTIIHALHYQGIPILIYKTLPQKIKLIFSYGYRRYLFLFVLGLITIPLLFYNEQYMASYVPILFLLSTLSFLIFFKLSGRSHKISYRVVFSSSVIGIISSFFIAYTLYLFSREHTREEVRQIGLGLANDIYLDTHYELADIEQALKTDSTIMTYLDQKNYQSLENYVLDKILPAFRDEYNISFYIFNEDELYIDSDQNDIYDSLPSYLYRQEYQTPSKNIYFVKGQYGHTYWLKADMEERDITLSLKSKYTYINPFVDNSTVGKYVTIKKRNILHYDYAIFYDGHLIKSTETYPYQYEFGKNKFGKAKSDTRIRKLGYIHTVSKHGDNNFVVVTHVNYDLFMIFQQTSFLMVIFIIYLLLFMIVDFWSFKRLTYNIFSVRIYYLIALLYIIPSTIINLVKVTTSNQKHKADILASNLENTVSLIDQVYNDYNNFHKKRLAYPAFLTKIKDLENKNKLNLSFYDAKGNLLYSDIPYMANHLEGQVYSDLFEHNKDYHSREFYASGVLFHNLYVTLKSNLFSEPLGVMVVSSFGLYHNYQAEQKASLATFFVSFAFIYIIALLTANLVVQLLHSPLRLISQKLLSTSLDEGAKITSYKGKDEIGLIIESYNKMLETLKRNKNLLRRNEQQIGWRKVAQDVAHEIKNPLTPIKLNLQNIKRILGKPNFFERINYVKTNINDILLQIELITNVIDSFRNFARMPLPKQESVDINKILKQAVNLYSNNETYIIDSQLPKEPYFCASDKDLLLRIFSNLILNAIESVDKMYKPKIKIKLELTKLGTLLISIRDNGEGISEDIEERIFMPNFTTKKTGSGIGLAIAKQGIEHAGGKIWFEANDPKGSIFYIQLPVLEKS